MSVSMRAAFEKAGYRDSREEWPSDELLQIAVNCMVRHANDTEATQHAIFRACRNDVELLRQLILPWWRQATASIISEARRTIERRERAGTLETAKERKAAKVISIERERESAREAKEREAELVARAKADRKYQEWREAFMRTQARDFQINGKYFWEVSTREAHEWQRHQGQRARFVELLLAGVPEDDRPVAHYCRPDEVDALWQKSAQ